MKNYFWTIESWGSDYPPENANEVINMANELIEAYAAEHDEDETANYSESLWERFCVSGNLVPANFAQAVELMDDEIREEMHREGKWDTEESFLREYERRHFEKYGEEFTI